MCHIFCHVAVTVIQCLKKLFFYIQQNYISELNTSHRSVSIGLPALSRIFFMFSNTDFLFFVCDQRHLLLILQSSLSVDYRVV